MTVAIITDQHFGMRKGSQIFHDYIKEFYDNVFFPTLEKENIKTVLDLGDTFDNRKSIDFWSLQWAKENYYDRLNAMGIQVNTLVGNHTAYYKNTLAINTVNLLLGEYKNVLMIDKPQTINVEGLDICFLPWICTENETETFSEVSNTKAKVCMGHLELSGFEAHVGYMMEHGMSSDLFSKFKKVFSGHFHHRSHAGNIYYLGNPYQMYWNDYKDPRGFHLFDTETLKLKFIKNPYEMFVKIFYNDQKENYSLVNCQQFSNRVVKMIVEKKSNHYHFDMFIENLYRAGIHELKIIDNAQEEITTDGDIEVEGTLNFLENYVEQIDYEDKDNLKNIIKTIYLESLEVE